ncbi:MAG: LodA/GoxA family CTQ-dependent oxidase [Candidatus Kapaibacterium sp.]
MQLPSEENLPSSASGQQTVPAVAGKDYIVRAAIHPGIGVARIGNSTEEDGYYIGPEVTNPPLTPAGATRDATGAIKRQAARFRIYGYNADGEVVRELTAGDAEIVWTAHLANTKSAWYQFQAALDIPEASTMSVPLRNASIKGSARESLAIDPGPRSISGAGVSGPDYQFDTGAFMGTPVPLGEVRTDDAGRLLVLGGLGASASPEGKPVFDPANPNSFNNADGWYDDISDGPVTATVSIGGRAIPVEPAWVAVAPPNYAPDVIAWRTLYDLLHDSYVQCGWLPFPDTASFTKDVLPSLRRLSNLQWVNKGFATMFGKGCPMDFDNPDVIAKLAYKPANAGDADPYAELRQQVFNAFRPANNKVNDPRTWPWIYGDAYGSFSDTSPRNNLALPDVRAGLLEFWVRGKFVNDWNGSMLPDGDIETLPIAEQPSMLDQAALHFCLADAFHPGCEMTWPMRHTTMYSAPFRIRHRTSGEPPLTYGSELTQEIVLLPGGPLYAQAPGDISRWMALPWQGDTAFCRSGYSPEYDPYLPTFWPARVPNQVLTQDDYETVIDTTLPRETRVAAYNNRENWLRALSGPAPQQMMEMIAEFGKMGIVEARPGVANDPDFPEMMMVECLPLEVAQALKAKASTRLLKAAPGAVPEEKSLLERAGWESAEQLEEFRRLIRW